MKVPSASFKRKEQSSLRIPIYLGLVLLGCTIHHFAVIRYGASNSAFWAKDQTRLLEGQGEGEEGGSANTANNEEGWKAIHIFHGPTGKEKLIQIGKAVGYSEVSQDLIVLQLLNQKKNGFFLDLAANHAVVLSNTYRLETTADWDGICIEPNPTYEWGYLHRKCTYVRAIVGANRMEKVRVALPSGNAGTKGGIVGEQFDNKLEAKNKPVDMFTVPLTEILDRFHAPPLIDYLSLDVEGAEFFVMQSFAFDRYQIRAMTIERPSQELVDMLYENGYVYLAAFYKHGDETLWALKSELPSLNTTVVGEKLYTTSTQLMEVTSNTLEDKPKVHAEQQELS